MPTMMANPHTYLYTPATAVAQSTPDAASAEKAAQSQAAGRARQ